MSIALQREPLTSYVVYEALPLKVLSLFPVIGSVTQLIAERGLMTEIKKASYFADKQRVIELIEVKNDYKAFAIARSVLMIALCIVLIALAVFTGSPDMAFDIALSSLLIAVFSFFAYLQYENISGNQQTIEHLRSADGHADPLKIY